MCTPFADLERPTGRVRARSARSPDLLAFRGLVGSVIRRHTVIHGRVQGVFFRDTARRQAESLGVAGWASNRPDGTVEAVFEGEPDAVESMLRFCRQGPRGAEVERVDVSEEKPEGLKGFAIR